MSSYRKYRTSRDRGTITFIFVAILIYGLMQNNAIMSGLVTIIKYVLITAALVAVLKVSVRLARYLKKLGQPRLKTVDSMTGVEFEHYVAKLLATQGYRRISLTERYDYGVDIIAEKDGIRWGIQVKRHTGLVKAIAVRQVVTALKKYRCERAMVVSNTQFSDVAIELARTNDCVLVGRIGLKRWIAAN